MGLRAIRLSLYYPQVFRTQLRALYRASVYGNLRIMLPLITDVAQVDTIKGIARGVQLSLKEEGIPFREDVPIGIMVETAAAAITSDCLAKNSAFFSIGTNDLIQYTLGIDRENPSVAPLYNEYNLAVIRLLHLIIHNSWKYDVPLSVCGEMAGRRESAIILAGMGIRTLSMAPRQIPIIKSTLADFSIRELENISSRAIL
jgi:phosphotransferase system enzyme I (PtsI)